MRRLVLAIAALSFNTLAASAEELRFGDLNYFLKRGTFNVGADVNETFYKQKLIGTNTVTRTILTTSSIAYAVTDQLNLSVGIGYAHMRNTKDKTTSTNGQINSDGLSNPELGANFRLLNQIDSSVNLDFGAVAAIGIQDAKTGDAVGNNKKDGNFANGRDSLELNLRVGQKVNIANEWQLATGLTYFADGESKDRQISGTVKVDEKSSTDLFVRASYQYSPVDEFWILLSAQAKRVGARDSKLKGLGKSESDAYFDYDFKFIAKYLVTDDFIVKFNYSDARLSNYDIKYLGSKESNNRRFAHSFGLGVDFLF